MILAGFFRYLTKPLRVEEFIETLDVALPIAGKGAAQGRRKGDDGHV